MNVQDRIDGYIDGQPQTKREELRALHERILRSFPSCKLWFLDGRDGDGKIVSNPNIGYGSAAITYANGDSKEFYRIGLSANTTGISVYVMGMEDKKFLSETYGHRLGKAKVTGYCVKFRSIRDLNIDILDELIAGRLGSGTA